MKNYEEVLAEAVRIELDNNRDDVFIVFKVVNEKFKQTVKNTWLDDIEYKLINKTLMTKER